MWWIWDAKLTIALLLEMTFISGILVRKYGGPGSDKLAAAVGIFGLAVVPFVYQAVNIRQRSDFTVYNAGSASGTARSDCRLFNSAVPVV